MLKSSDPAYLRLLEEKATLEKKVEALDSFIKKCRMGEVEAVTSIEEIHLLEEQLHYMRGYLRCISARIAQVVKVTS